MDTHAATMWNTNYENPSWNVHAHGFATDIESLVTGTEPWMDFSNLTYYPSNVHLDTYSNVAHNEHETVIAEPSLHAYNVEEPLQGGNDYPATYEEPFQGGNDYPATYHMQGALIPDSYQPNAFSRSEQMDPQLLHYTAPVPQNTYENSSNSQFYQVSAQQSPPQLNDHPPNVTVLEQQIHSNQFDCYPTTLSDVNQIQQLQTSSPGESSTNISPVDHTQQPFRDFTMGEHQMLESHRTDHYYPATLPVNQQLPQTPSQDESSANYSPSYQGHIYQQPCGEVTMGEHQMQMSHRSDNYPPNTQTCQTLKPYSSTNHEYASASATFSVCSSASPSVCSSASPSVCSSAHYESDPSSLDKVLRVCNNISEYPASFQTNQVLEDRQDALLGRQRVEQGSPAHNESDLSSLDDILRTCNNVSEYPASFQTNDVRVDWDPLFVRQCVERGGLIHSRRARLQCDAHKAEFPQHDRTKLMQAHELTDIKEKPFRSAVRDRKFARADDLEIHESIHFEGKVFQCGACNKSFAFKSLLRNHKQNYTDTKPFKCKWCKKSYRYSESLLEHVRFDHVEQMLLFHRDKCPVKYGMEQSLLNTTYKLITPNKTSRETSVTCM